jgi:hypothetical protein
MVHTDAEEHAMNRLKQKSIPRTVNLLMLKSRLHRNRISGKTGPKEKANGKIGQRSKIRGSKASGKITPKIGMKSGMTIIGAMSGSRKEKKDRCIQVTIGKVTTSRNFPVWKTEVDTTLS